MEDSGGTAQFEEPKITQIIVQYYENLFAAQETPSFAQDIINEALDPRVSTVENEELIKLPTQKEIKEAFLAIHGDKAPGPDGFPAVFYQEHWDTVGPAISDEIMGFFTTSSMPTDYNVTHVRLIPKISNPKKPEDYRPIALCNVVYKAISKILTARLRPLLDSLISENQSAFVPGRAITDNVLITHEALHYLQTSKAKKHVYMAIKTDMSKAYDRLEWSFLEAVLQRLGFHPKWISWIMACVTSVSYAYLFNNEAKGQVIPQRGIRQGDPLSPYLFILCSEVLSGLCSKAQLNGSLPGIQVARQAPRVNHLLFADDTLFFCKASEEACCTLKDILYKYEQAAGQKINPQKSGITFSSKTPDHIKVLVKETLGISKEGGSGKYLGLPEHFGRKKKDLFTSIVDRVNQRAINWSSRFLSPAGKLTMIKSVLSSLPTYAMSCFKLPRSLTRRIQSAITRFWWDAPDKRKMCWVAWDKLAIPKTAGGLGFREITRFNDSLLAKSSWRILQNPDSLLAKVLTGKYCQDSSFLDVQPRGNCSHGWRGILIGRDLLRPHLTKLIGTGQDTRI